MGKKDVDKHKDDPYAAVREQIKAGKLKKKCCKSKPRCKRCPVVAMRKLREPEAA